MLVPGGAPTPLRLANELLLPRSREGQVDVRVDHVRRTDAVGRIFQLLELQALVGELDRLDRHLVAARVEARPLDLRDPGAVQDPT